MIPHFVRVGFYAAAWPLMAANGAIYRFVRAPRNGIIRVHLGPGRDKYIKGWMNLDANIFTGKCDLWIDLRNRLPFKDDTIAALYSHHVIEHLPDMRRHLNDCFRVLKPGGIYRLGGPNGDSAVRKYLDNDHDWFGDFPDKRRSMGGRLENFIFCRREHLTVLTFSFLQELLEDAGFDEIRLQAPISKTGYPALFDDAMQTEWESDFETPHSLIVECRKPLVHDAPRGTNQAPNSPE
jgi:predicted SAM-dependent methyltransferase